MTLDKTLLAASLLMFVACSGDDGKTDTDTDESDTDTDTDTDADADADADSDSDTDADTDTDMGSVRVLHLSPDAGAVDVFLDGDSSPLLTAVPFLAGTGYLTVPAGSHTFDIAPAGAGIGAAVLSATVDVTAGGAYSATAYGTVGNGTLDLLALVDDDGGIASGDVRLQISHTADGVGQVDLWELAGPSAVLSDVDFGATASVDVAGGALPLGLDVNDDASPDWQFSVPDLGTGALIDVYAVATQADGPFLVAHLPDGSVATVGHDPRLRVLHASPTTPNVDVWVDAAAAFTDLAYTESTMYASLPAGTPSVDVLVAGTPYPGTAALAFDLPIVTGKDYTAVAWGNSAPMALPLEDSVAGLAAGSIRLQLVHGAEGVPAVDVREATSGTALVTDFSLGDVESIDLPQGAYAVGLDIGQNGTSDLVFDVPDLGAGIAVNVVAVREGASVKLLAQLPDGTTALLSSR